MRIKNNSKLQNTYKLQKRHLETIEVLRAEVRKIKRCGRKGENIREETK